MSFNELASQSVDGLRDRDSVGLHGFEGVLYARAVRLVRHPPDAWDLVQDTFEHALRGQGRFQPGTNLRVWLMTIMQHLFIDRCRKLGREPRSEPIDEELIANPEPDSTSLPDWAYISDEEVAAAMATLESPFREVYRLRLVDNCSYDEIAERLLIPRSTVGTRLMRARTKLRKTLLRSRDVRGRRARSAPAGALVTPAAPG
jgi:RNA polymerase sigma-70 factor (ECF subfamily)